MDGSLYERLGGLDGILAAARDFEARAGKDDRINQKFAKTNFDRLTKEFADQICEATGGQCAYTGRNMKEAHLNMGVTSGEFDAFMADLVATLEGFNVSKTDQDQIVSMLNSFRDAIVEVDSSQVGTPLPSAFIPAPPL